ncbi:kinase-like protein, partial [Glonium stellatum]
MNGFVAENLTDISLPYTERNLPHSIKGEEQRARFLSLQKVVLNQEIADLEKEGGPHRHFIRSADEHFPSLKQLGTGGFGKLVGSYTDPQYVGLIMRPVADRDLAAYFAWGEPEERKLCLRTFFGCLANAVLYLHENKFRHKDIKPANILIRGTEVYLTDFGTSRNWSDETRGTTSGEIAPFTPRYCAPEVAGHDPRGRPSDIWALGCVFVEMASVLNNRTMQEMRDFFAEHGT